MGIPGNEVFIIPSIFYLAQTISITSRMTEEYGMRISRTVLKLMYLQIPLLVRILSEYNIVLFVALYAASLMGKTNNKMFKHVLHNICSK